MGSSYIESALKSGQCGGHQLQCGGSAKQPSKQARSRYLTIGYLENLETRPSTRDTSSPSRVYHAVNVYWPWHAHGLNMGLKPASNRQPSQGIMSLLQAANTSELLQHQPVLPGQLLELLPLLLDDVLERLALAPALSQLRLQSAENRGFRGR